MGFELYVIAGGAIHNTIAAMVGRDINIKVCTPPFSLHDREVPSYDIRDVFFSFLLFILPILLFNTILFNMMLCS
jgi:hypothetical protein